jgi:hypothetical protein
MKILVVILLCISIGLSGCTVNIYSSGESPETPNDTPLATDITTLNDSKNPTPTAQTNQNDDCYSWSNIPNDLQENVCIFGYINSVEQVGSTWRAYFGENDEREVRLEGPNNLSRWNGKCIKVQSRKEFVSNTKPMVILNTGFARITEIASNICK